VTLQAVRIPQTPKTEPTVFQVALSGELDLERAPELNVLVDSFRRSRHTHVEIDVRQVTFIDSAGLTLLVRLWREAQQRGGSVDLVGPTGICLRVLQATCLDKLFEIRPA
jgi:anti-sigma B factor antagonist